MDIKLKDERLVKRWKTLVRTQTKSASPLAAGVGSLPGPAKSLAATQAAWRFYNNYRIELPELVVPLRDHAREQIAGSDAPFVLLAHDWCKLSFPGHSFRQDVAELSNSSDVGYELTTSLAISAETGAPLAPVEMHLKTKDVFLSTRNPAPAAVPHLEQILPTMEASRDWNFAKPIVHVIDREADSVGHYREWTAAGHMVLIRGGDRRVKWADRRIKLSQIRTEMLQAGAFRSAGAALYHGRPAELEVAETAVVLHRPARKTIAKKRVDIPGVPLTMRLILTRIVDADGQLLAEWYLLSNVPMGWADATKLAICYYWRWKIETYFKLIKSHGFQLEHWLQETGIAILRRLLVASMAAVTVWQLMVDESPQATELKSLLIQMSGRQLKRKRPHTAPALLAGLWSLLVMIDTLEQYDVSALKALVTQVRLPIPLLQFQ